MKTVNPVTVDFLLLPMIGLADDDDEVKRYWNLSPDNEGAYREIIRERLKPEFDRLSSEDRDEAKTCLSYYLTKCGPAFFERLFDKYLLPFGNPRESRQFFVWLWEEYFGAESYVLPDWQDYQEVEDLERQFRVKRQ